METDWVGPGDSLAVEDKGEGGIYTKSYPRFGLG